MTATTKAKFEVSPKEQSQDRQLRLEEELADSFPASDPPSITQPGVKLGGPDRNASKAGNRV